MAAKLDLKKQWKDLYTAKATPVFVTVPALKIVAVDGEGDPNTSVAYQQAIEALYAVSYKVKFSSKTGLGTDYTVMPLEGLWWTDDMRQFSIEHKEGWKWTAFIVQPDFVTEKMVAAARDAARKTKPSPMLESLRFMTFEEGLSAQILHIGPFANEGPTIAALHEFIKNEGRSFDGIEQKHHEIYLSDFRRTPPEKLKTIIRQPVKH
jgi:hypothetical protein